MVLHKRKYHTLHNKQQITLKKIGDLAAYQCMTPDACVSALNLALDNKCSCVCVAPPTQIMPYTHNTVSTVHIAVGVAKLDLEFIARSLRYSTYDRKRFAAITIRISNPKITALLFSSGKLVVTGAVSKQMAMNATRQIIGNLRRLYRLSSMSYSRHLIQNIVCNVCVPDIMTIDISRIYKEHNNLCTYQPKIFPGLIFRPSRSPIVLLVFKSSRIIVTGTTFLRLRLACSESPTLTHKRLACVLICTHASQADGLIATSSSALTRSSRCSKSTLCRCTHCLRPPTLRVRKTSVPTLSGHRDTHARLPCTKQTGVVVFIEFEHRSCKELQDENRA